MLYQLYLQPYWFAFQGSVPFILREHLSYSQLGAFALSSYPYSFKLLWSPIVDALYFPSIGRRKSWIIPMQLIIGSLMLYISANVQKLLDAVSHQISIRCSFNYLAEFTIVAGGQCIWTDRHFHVPCPIFCHTRCASLFASLIPFWPACSIDIAVDGKMRFLVWRYENSYHGLGWALTLLSPENLSYASTCQTIGLNTGYFASFTVFLAFNSEAFVYVLASREPQFLSLISDTVRNGGYHYSH